MVTTRFAPSPTGRLHLGHAYSAMLAHDAARAASGRFLLRIEDIDATRCRPKYIDGIDEDLRWLGLEWDAQVVQSARIDAYDEALDRLNALGVAYRCFCTRGDILREITASVGAPHGVDGPLYPGTCRALDTALQSDREHCWRLDCAAAIALTGPLVWQDAVVGEVAVDVGAVGDVVIKGRERAASYHLAVVVDDADLGVTDVIRGRDIFASTHAHRLLQAALGLPTPRYTHHALVVDEMGRRLAKRAPGVTVADLRASGTDPGELLDALRGGRLPVGFAFANA